MALPRPGQIHHRDYRLHPVMFDDDVLYTQGIRVMTWNIERGYELRRILAEIRAARPHVICLQEVDWHCARTNFADVGGVIAHALRMNYMFVTEFEELDSPLRNERTQGGGVHGNAILTCFDFEQLSCHIHRHQPVNWTQEGASFREPRNGFRCAPVAVMSTPLGSLVAMSVHLEVFCGLSDRVRQFLELLDLAKDRFQHVQMQVIAGDMNTSAHGIARLSPYYCRDMYRFLSFGRTESEFWQRHVLSEPELNPGFQDPFDVNLCTLSNYSGLYVGKLDHIFIRGARTTLCEYGGELADLGEGPGISDHRWLLASIKTNVHHPFLPSPGVAAGSPWRRQVTARRRIPQPWLAQQHTINRLSDWRKRLHFCLVLLAFISMMILLAHTAAPGTTHRHDQLDSAKAD